MGALDELISYFFLPELVFTLENSWKNTFFLHYNEDKSASISTTKSKILLGATISQCSGCRQKGKEQMLQNPLKETLLQCFRKIFTMSKVPERKVEDIA